MGDQSISLLAVDALRLGEDKNPRRFFIPGYQRGYRWSSQQVCQLLEDVLEFSKRRDPQPDEFYCLQPLVIKARPSDGTLEVVDGQQRLTTLMLILRHFNERLTEKFRQPLFGLEYETRPGLDGFLEAPSETSANQNADYFHLHAAIETINSWFAERESEVETVKTALLKQTKVIWFQLAVDENPVDAFTRLNVGKIPLTNDELIRALFLRRGSLNEADASHLQLRIAYEWDQLEKAMQSDAFWYFLSNSGDVRGNRIGFLFDLVAEKECGKAKADEYATFYAFNDLLRQPDKTPEWLWGQVKAAFMALEEWYEDRWLFHAVGFLVSQDESIADIRALAADCTKTQFVHRLRARIFRRVIGEGFPAHADHEAIREAVAGRVEVLNYRQHRSEVRSLLLLFNVATLLQDRRSNLRFQFENYKTERWDIEHIRSVTDDRPDRHPDRVKWFDNVLGYWKSARSGDDQQDEDLIELAAAIENFVSLSQGEADTAVFDQLYEQVLEHFSEARESEAEHGIGNLTLLDESTNRSYKNAVFAVKRMRLLKLDQAGIFVPLCTRNVFLKCYSPRVDHALFWTEEDLGGYESAIVDVLVGFFTGTEQVAS